MLSLVSLVREPTLMPTCPLDSWVIILAIVSLVFAVIHLYRKHSGQPKLQFVLILNPAVQAYFYFIFSR